MNAVLQSLRGFRHRPLFTVTVVGILALGIGATTAVFSVINGLLLSPLPYPDQDRLVRVWKNDVARSFDHIPVTYPEIERWSDASVSFEVIGGLWNSGPFDATLAEGDVARHVGVLTVTSNFFDVLRVPALIGRTFNANDDVGGDEPAVMLSHGLWARELAADPDVVGRSIRLLIGSHETFRVIGVLPPGIDYPATAGAYIPALAYNPEWRTNRFFEADVVARLRPDVSADDARAELATIYAGMTQEDPRLYPEMPIVMTALLDTVVGDVRASLWFLFGAVGLVLTIAAANVASLLLVRGAERDRELAIRVAMGAGRARLVRQLLTETLMLAVAGGAAGLLVAYWGLRFLLSLRPDALPRADGIGLDPVVLTFAIVTTLAACLAAGSIPAWRASGQDALATLRRGRGILADWRAMSALVVFELAVAFVLVVGAGLLGRAFVAQSSIERGFAVDKLHIASLQIPDAKYPKERLIDFTDRLIERVQSLPGVSSATTVHVEPGRGLYGITGPLRVEGQTDDDAKRNPFVNIEIVHEDYFRTLGIPLHRGRRFTENDRGNDTKVAIVSESFAAHHWPGQDPIGRRIGGGDNPLVTVVGVTGDVRYRELTRSWLEVYFPIGQNPFRDVPGFFWFRANHLMVRSNLGAEALAPSLRAAVHELDPDVPVESVAPVETVLDTELAKPRFQAVMLGSFAAVALLLAAVGIYGVMATLTGARAPEVGIRLALGSTPAQAVHAIWQRGAFVTGIGIVLGLAAAALTTRFMTSFLYEVSPLDPTSFAGAAVFLTATALMAAYLPARRAARVDPAITLRHE